MGCRLIRFGTVTLPELDADDDLPLAGVQSPLVLGSNGWFDAAGSGRARRAPARVRWGRVVAEDSTAAQRAAVTAVLGLAAQRLKLWREWSDGTREWAWARVLDGGQKHGPHDVYVSPLELEFSLVSEWRGERHSGGWVLDDGELLDDGLYLDESGKYTLSSSPLAITLENGNAVVRAVTITVTAGSAAITLLTIRNATSACCLVFDGTVAAGKSVVIDAGAQSVLNDGVAAYAHLVRDATYHQNGAWFEVWPGNNSITVTKTGGSTDSTITFDYYEGQE